MRPLVGAAGMWALLVGFAIAVDHLGHNASTIGTLGCVFLGVGGGAVGWLLGEAAERGQR